jgi:hypothetical protein
MEQDKSNLPNYQRPELLAVLDDLGLIADLLAGTRRMHDRATTYIRKWTDESDAVYLIRRKMANLFGGLSRTLSAAVGMLFAKAPTIEWNASEERIKPHWDNIDNMGTAGHVFAKRFSEQAIRDGLAIILVDHTPPPLGVVIHAGNEDDLGLRPAWAMYQRCQVWSWRTSSIGNKRVLTQVVFHELVEVPIGQYGTKVVNQWRILGFNGAVAMWKVLRQKVSSNGINSETDLEPAGAGVFKNKAGQLATSLPIAIAYTGRTDAPMTASIPLLDVAWANLAHWQQSTDLRFYRSLCAFPQPVVTGSLQQESDGKGGVVQGKLRVGPMVGVHVQAEGSFAWAELTGTALDQIEKGILESEKQIAALGMSFLAQDKRSAETAEAKRLDATAENSTLGTAAQGIEDAINTAYEWHGWYMGIAKKDCPVITLNKDFENTAMDAATMTAYVQAVVQAGLPPRVLLEAWKAGGRLPMDTDIDEMEADMLAAQAQKEDAAREIEANKPEPKGPKAVDIIGPNGEKKGRIQPAEDKAA